MKKSKNAATWAYREGKKILRGAIGGEKQIHTFRGVEENASKRQKKGRSGQDGQKNGLVQGRIEHGALRRKRVQPGGTNPEASV